MRNYPSAGSRKASNWDQCLNRPPVLLLLSEFLLAASIVRIGRPKIWDIAKYSIYFHRNLAISSGHRRRGAPSGSSCATSRNCIVGKAFVARAAGAGPPHRPLCQAIRQCSRLDPEPASLGFQPSESGSHRRGACGVPPGTNRTPLRHADWIAPWSSECRPTWAQHSRHQAALNVSFGDWEI
jgi:hypothetical protein